MSARKSSYVFEYRFTILGAEKTGKSSLLRQFVERKFSAEHIATTENHLTHVVEHKKNLCVCLLVDTAGSDDFPAMRKLSITKGNAFIVVYSIDNRKSFECAKKLVETIKYLKHGSKEIKIVIVGNKNDLLKQRNVTYEEGLDFASKLHEGNVISSFLEANSKDYHTVELIFQKLLTMFSSPPPQIEVPVLLERRSTLGRIKIGARRASKGLIERKNSSPVIKVLRKTQSLSDSEVERSPKPFPSPRNVFRKMRMRSDSQPVVKTISEDNRPASPSPSPSPFRPRASSATSSISSPKLLNHSLTFNRYNLQKTSFQSVDSVCSNDSGVSDECYSPVFPRNRVMNFSELSPVMGNKFQRSHSTLSSCNSLPVTSQQFFSRSTFRRSSLSEKMRGIFKRTKSSSN